MWRHGFIEIKHITKREGVARYLTKYLTKEKMNEKLIQKKKYSTSRGLKKEQIITEPELAQSILVKLTKYEQGFSTSYSKPDGNEIQYSLYRLADEEIHELGFGFPVRFWE